MRFHTGELFPHRAEQSSFRISAYQQAGLDTVGQAWNPSVTRAIMGPKRVWRFADQAPS